MELAAEHAPLHERAHDRTGVADVHDDRKAELVREIELCEERALLVGLRRAASREIDADLADRDDALVGREPAERRERDVIP